MPHVSISHTRDLVAVAVSDAWPVGVDVEHGDRPMLDEALLDRACTPREREDLRAVPAGRRNRRFVQLWTLKESYAKALGRGLAVDFRELGFTLPPSEGAAPAGEPPGVADSWRFQLATVSGGYASACAVRVPPVPLSRTIPNPTRSTA
jgi:4'-phosphopantetheinyl transferase